jgi:hypothetical protein
VCTALCAVAVRAVADDMFLTPRFVPKTIEELRGQGTDAAELARQEARLKQQVRHESVAEVQSNTLFESDSAQHELCVPSAEEPSAAVMRLRSVIVKCVRLADRSFWTFASTTDVCCLPAS